MNALLVLGNQLFDPRLIKAAVSEKIDFIFMREDRELCTYFRFHKHKIVFFLAAMRTFAKEAEAAGIKVHYETLSDNEKYEARLKAFLKSKKIKKLYHFEIEDLFFENRIKSSLGEWGIESIELPTPMFMHSREEFADYLTRHKRPFMKTFYEETRKKRKILVDSSLKPVGGRWSFDTENRKSLPDKVELPGIPALEETEDIKAVKKLVDQEFANHPGDTKEYWLPVQRKDARQWLADFLDRRLTNFGPYEDALSDRDDFLFHSVLTPFLNTGLLTPKEVVDACLRRFEKHQEPITSTEGFIRQVIGWREFIRGIYRGFDSEQRKRNFFEHKQNLSKLWYTGKTGLLPLDRAIQKTLRRAYNHHIERLMVIGNLMTLLEIDPKQAHRWFMEMYVDSSDWVMGPNVYGMALFSDGGIFATKPYVCGSNFYRKMGKFKAGDWSDEVDGLYWDFILKHASRFQKNPRMQMIVSLGKSMSKEKRTKLRQAADRARERILANV